MTITILNNCTVEGNVVKLPEGQLDRKDYEAVAKALQGIGGKWKGGKVMGFVFPSDPTERLAQIQGGEKINLKKEFQFFATPAAIADILVELANIQAGDTILEPSAGQGAIIEAVRRRDKSVNITGIELMRDNYLILNEKFPHERKVNCMIEEDFLKRAHMMENEYSKVIANPPFAKNQDIDHVRAMYACLRDGGTLVSIMSNHWKTCDNKKETDFREWITSMNAEIHNLPYGTFKESGTNVAACIVVINK